MSVDGPRVSSREWNATLRDWRLRLRMREDGISRQQVVRLDQLRLRKLLGAYDEDSMVDTRSRPMWVDGDGVFHYPPETVRPRHLEELREQIEGYRP